MPQILPVTAHSANEPACPFVDWLDVTWMTGTRSSLSSSSSPTLEPVVDPAFHNNMSPFLPASDHCMQIIFFPVICRSTSNSDQSIFTVGFLFSLFPQFWQPLFVGTRISPGVFRFRSNLARPWSSPILSQRSRRWKGGEFRLTTFFRFVRKSKLRVFRLPSRCQWELRLCGILHSVDW